MIITIIIYNFFFPDHGPKTPPLCRWRIKSISKLQVKEKETSGSSLYYNCSCKLRQTPECLTPCPCLYKTLPKEVCTNSEALVQINNQSAN